MYIVSETLEGIRADVQYQVSVPIPNDACMLTPRILSHISFLWISSMCKHRRITHKLIKFIYFNSNTVILTSKIWEYMWQTA